MIARSLTRGCGWTGVAIAATLSLSMASPAASAPAARVLHVGPGLRLASPSAAAAVARDGDTVEIEAGDYSGDVAMWSADRLTLRGVHGMARLDAAGRSAQDKAIWVIRGNDTTVENIGFSGCRVPDHNGAGIRHEGRGLVVRHCLFHHNENGILTGADPQSDILIESSEFHHNGSGDGYSHNLYIGRVRTLTLRFCISRDALAGHLVKSRAASNRILYNRLLDGPDGASSYIINLPNGGRGIIIGNVLRHGPRAQNAVAVSFGEEGDENPLRELFVVNNTAIHDRAGQGVFVRVAGEGAGVTLANNLIAGACRLLEGPGETRGNLVTAEPGFVDAGHFDFRLGRGSPAVGAGIEPGKTGGLDLTPEFYGSGSGSMEPVPRPPDAPLNLGACPAAESEPTKTSNRQ